MKYNRTTIILKDLRLLIRDYIIAVSLLLIGFLLICSGLMTYISWNSERVQSIDARVNFRKQWESQHTNPHNAAHYGTYLFKPTNLLGFFDHGLDDYFGTTYRVEAHKQTELEHIKAVDSESVTRFGPLSFALILQLLVPLMLLCMSSSAITGEKESGTWKMLLAQGMKPAQIVWQKVWANYILALLIIVPVCLLFSAIIALSDNLLLTRFLFLALCYFVYYFIIVIIGVLVSGLSKRSGNALVVVFIIWLLLFILFPPMFNTSADRLNPLISRATFKNSVEEGYLKGLDGHDPYYERGERNLKQLLIKYHVDSLSRLPVDAAGITLQMNEDYQNMVFEHYYHQIKHTLSRQQIFLSRASLLSPFLAMKRISATACGTDFYQHSDFYDQARTYRNNLIRKLNMELAQHPVNSGRDYVAAPAFFKSIKEFTYQMPGMVQIINWQFFPIISLLLWLLISAALLQTLTKWL